MFSFASYNCPVVSGEEGMWGKRPSAERQRAHVAIGARAQHALTRSVTRGGAEAEAEAAHAEKPRLRGELPGEARVPARSPGAAEEGAAAGGGAAGRRERRHEARAGRVGRSSCCPPALRQRFGIWRRQSARHHTPSEHSLRHHHSEDATAGAHP